MHRADVSWHFIGMKRQGRLCLSRSVVSMVDAMYQSVFLRVQHRLSGVQDGAWNRDGMRDTKELEAGCGMKSSSRDRDTQFFTVGMQNVLKSMVG